MGRLRNLKVEDEKIEIISTVLSRFIHDVDEFGKLEGAFVVSCSTGVGVSTMLVELVHDSDSLGKKIISTDKSYLEDASMLTGINIKVESIPYRYYEEFHYDSFDFPYNGMLKSGHIIYDANGNLENFQRKFKKNPYIDNLSWRGIVKSRPPIQYKKEM